jgi:hypothetical protein
MGGSFEKSFRAWTKKNRRACRRFVEIVAFSAEGAARLTLLRRWAAGSKNARRKIGRNAWREM